MKPVIKRMWWSLLFSILATTVVFVLFESALKGTQHIGGYAVLILVSVLLYGFPAYTILVILHCWLVEKKNWQSTITGFFVASGIVALMLLLPVKLKWSSIHSTEVIEMLPYILGGGIYGLVYGLYRRGAKPTTIN
ncbi:hypothetical protein J0X19_15850 [Hymenobacter sp. BT186]|uniref:Uncharacterized protein n=1 Tax=Hymenobacter telluris TaxID=2816474 RepID=A0A939F0Y7_9BACT|nr:hypothetical protein [Hymenobacter telluris]MBO0359438.1 hypothetical protein [Hymenobacter telluris]MBW3375464.1 hypothetical protein [Hymenobacter norwichensis]